LQSVDAGRCNCKYSTWIRKALRVNLDLIEFYQPRESPVPAAVIDLVCPSGYQEFQLLAADKGSVANEQKEREILRRVE
jgi:hypothetical protein